MTKSRNFAMQQNLMKKLFWKLLKGQGSSTQLSAFLAEDRLITGRNLIQEIWVSYFETLGTLSNSENFDSNFLPMWGLLTTLVYRGVSNLDQKIWFHQNCISEI